MTVEKVIVHPRPQPPPLPWERKPVPGDQSQKADAGKMDWLLFPWKAARAILRVLEYGARRYSRGGWRKVDNALERYTNAAMRHLIAYSEGQYWDLCPEHPTHAKRPADCKKCSGEPHLAHLGCCNVFLLELDAPESHPTV